MGDLTWITTVNDEMANGRSLEEARLIADDENPDVVAMRTPLDVGPLPSSPYFDQTVVSDFGSERRIVLSHGPGVEIGQVWQNLTTGTQRRIEQIITPGPLNPDPRWGDDWVRPRYDLRFRQVGAQRTGRMFEDFLLHGYDLVDSGDAYREHAGREEMGECGFSWLLSFVHWFQLDRGFDGWVRYSAGMRPLLDLGMLQTSDYFWDDEFRGRQVKLQPHVVRFAVDAYQQIREGGRPGLGTMPWTPDHARPHVLSSTDRAVRS